MNMKKICVLSFTMASLSLTGCLGLTSTGGAPDEMAVIDGAPLSLPPSFELRPPVKGKTIDRAQKTAESRRLLLGTQKQPQATTTEGWLVQQAGGDARDADIRNKITDEDTKAVVEDKNKSFFSKLFSNDKKNAAAAAKAEKEAADAAAQKAQEEAQK